MPNPLCFFADHGVMNFLKVPATPAERRDCSGRHVLLQDWGGQPLARANMYQVNGHRGLFGVIEVRAGNTPQPEQPVDVTGPDERALCHLCKALDATGESLLFGIPGHALPESTNSEPTSAIESGLPFHGIAAGPHRSAIHRDHKRHRPSRVNPEERPQVRAAALPGGVDDQDVDLGFSGDGIRHRSQQPAGYRADAQVADDEQICADLVGQM